jgi:hypothetical protein
MWTIAFVAALSSLPAQNGGLAVTNVRTTYGLLGAPRTDSKFLPGDHVFISFDIEGVKADADGKVSYSVGLEVADPQGKTLFKQTPRDLETINSLGGSSLAGFANLKIGVDQKPGLYTVKVKVTDRAAKTSKEVSKSVEVLPKAFGLVRLISSVDPDGQIQVPFLGVGQSVWINFAAVGFTRGQNGQPDLSVSLRVLDEQGKPVTAKPMTGAVNKDIPKNLQALPMQFMLNLNRAGKFTVEVTATDKGSGTSATVSLPLTVLKAKASSFE